MKLLPEKVEGKIFVLVLIICLSMSLLAARLIVMSQENTVVSANRARLSNQAERSRALLDHTLRERAERAAASNTEIERSISDTGGPSRPLSDRVDARDSVKIQSKEKDPNDWSDTTRRRVEAVAPVLERMSALMLVDFDHYFVHLIDEDVTLHTTTTETRSYEIPAFRPPARPEVQSAGPAANPAHGPVWAAPFSTPGSRHLRIRVLVPIYIHGNFVGVSGGELSASSLFADVQEDKEELYGNAIVFDSSGRLIAGENPPAPDQIVDELVRHVNTTASSSDMASPLMIDSDFGVFHAYVSRIQTFDWHIATVASNATLYQELNALKWKLGTFAVAIALVLVFLLRASFRQLFINRILALERATRAFAQHGIVNFPVGGNDEIGSLVHAFEEMVESLSSREAELTIRNQQLKNEISGRLSAVESLRESERKFRTLFDKSSDAVLVFDGERYIDCNEAAVMMLGYDSKAQLLAADPVSFHPVAQPDGRNSAEKASEMMEVAKQKGEHRYEWVCQTLDGHEFWVEVVLTLIPYGGREVLYTVWRDISARKHEEEERIRLTTALEQAAEVIIVTDADGTMLYVNPSFERLTQYTRDEAIGHHSDLIHAENQDKNVLAEMRNTIRKGQVWKGRIANTRKDGTLYQAETTISPVRDASDSIINYVIVSYDVTKEATLEAQLIQAQKMEAIGELASGIAHEINTPTQYIGDNIRFFQESFNDILELLDKYDALVQAVESGDATKDTAKTVTQFSDEIELGYLKEEVPVAIQQSLEGNARVAEIVRAMKEFAHPGLEEKTAIDVNHAIRNTLAVARNEWKYVADVELDLDPSLPEVPCLPGSFNQVILNIVVNASHAIADVVGDGSRGKGTISIATRAVDSWAEVRIKDTGTGIPKKVLSKIFDPFFTTKGVGKGTGQGLALAHAVIVEKHGGTIEVETAQGAGTTFIVRVPLADAQPAAEEPELAGATVDG